MVSLPALPLLRSEPSPFWRELACHELACPELVEWVEWVESIMFPRLNNQLLRGKPTGPARTNVRSYGRVFCGRIIKKAHIYMSFFY